MVKKIGAFLLGAVIVLGIGELMKLGLKHLTFTDFGSGDVNTLSAVAIGMGLWGIASSLAQEAFKA